MALFNVSKQHVPSNLLKDRFIVPPFSILDAEQGYWRQRKKNWLSLGIKSELGRGEKLLFGIDAFDYKSASMAYSSYSGNSIINKRKAPQTSIFDPVLCEIAYKWFTCPGDVILDPFAGGSVRGLIAGILGYKYFGVDLRNVQVLANRDQYLEFVNRYKDILMPEWYIGNSLDIKNIVPNIKYNLIFSCPPYYNLEHYSEDFNDLSNKTTYQDFLHEYQLIIQNCVDLLDNDSFAIFVVANIRDKNTGYYYNLVGDTVRAFESCGCNLYNDIVYSNVRGSVPLRSPGQFNNSRKVGKMHQNFLVFYKGNTKNIKDKFGVYEKEEV